MKPRKSFLRKQHIEEEMNLQITSMADIFMIILVFLLKGYSTGAVEVQVSSGMTLPVATAGETAVQALKVEISESAILVESKPAAKIEKFIISKSDVGENGTSKSLSAILNQERQKQLLIAKSNPSVKVDPRIIVIADQRAPYSTIKAVLASAAVNGYTDFKLAVVRKD